jgi:hypothetical protein
MCTMTFNPFRRRKKGPDKAFSHSDTCKILAADPTVSIPWTRSEPDIGRHGRLRRRGLARA